MDELFSSHWRQLAQEEPDKALGRVIQQEKGRYRILTARGEESAWISGRFQYEAGRASDYPVVGDYVLVTQADDVSSVIHRVLPRKSLFLRRGAGRASAEQAVAANIDTVFLCMSLNHDYNLRRLERYLAMAWESGATPVVLVTKTDLCDDLGARLLAAQQIAIGADVLATSARTQGGMEPLAPYIRPGRTVAFIGSSGVGKSTLINCLLGEGRLATNGLRNDDRGRHTTTRRQMIRLPSGAMVIDTPGMREMGMWEAEQGMKQTFAEIEALAAQCRYPHCSHQAEPGCAVRAALEAGMLDAARWRSYAKLTRENAYAADQAGYLAAKEKRFKEIARINKDAKRRDRR